MIEINGSQGEGGGQILRTALALSILTGQPFTIHNIRAGRKIPGLAPQHLAGVMAAAEICGAEVHGARLRSMQVTFQPTGKAQPGRYTFDVSKMAGQGSAGAVTLLLQTLILPLALAGGSSELILRGGTHVAWSPPSHYVQWVLLPVLARIGVRSSLDLKTWGWYPQGGGEVRVRIQGRARLRGIDLSERGELERLEGVAAASNLPSHIPQRIAARANNVLREAGLPARIEPARLGGPSTGAGIFLAATYKNACVGFSALGEKGKPSDQVADEAALALAAFERQAMALDEHLPDQIIPALALAEGSSALTTYQITQHTLTSAAVVDIFTGRRIVVEGAEGEPGTVRVERDKPASTS